MEALRAHDRGTQRKGGQAKRACYFTDSVEDIEGEARALDFDRSAKNRDASAGAVCTRREKDPLEAIALHFRESVEIGFAASAGVGKHVKDTPPTARRHRRRGSRNQR